ncbi:MAG: Zn-dependent exopeptidase M28 [Planctomycetes bacterium]|nr:Zn-dependent exopeptidase M28 [Planctomycetota bacterium]
MSVRRLPLALASAPLVLLGACASSCREQPAPQPAPAPSAAAHDLGARAYAHVATLCDLGARHSGTTGWERALDHIFATLRDAGLSPERDRWVDANEGLTFENVSVVIHGARPERILLACHHDTKVTEGHPEPLHNFPFVGANDSGSGVGLVLELARDLAQRPLAVSVEVAFFDGEESIPFDWDVDRALFGSKRFATRYRLRRAKDPDSPPIVAMVLLDMVGATELSIDEEEYSTPELRELVRTSARALGHDGAFFANRLPVRDDHVPFLDIGIPAVDLIDIADNPQWHTVDDVLENVSAASLQVVGEVVWDLLPRIAARYAPRAR